MHDYACFNALQETVLKIGPEKKHLNIVEDADISELINIEGGLATASLRIPLRNKSGEWFE